MALAATQCLLFSRYNLTPHSYHLCWMHEHPSCQHRSLFLTIRNTYSMKIHARTPSITCQTGEDLNYKHNIVFGKRIICCVTFLYSYASGKFLHCYFDFSQTFASVFIVNTAKYFYLLFFKTTRICMCTCYDSDSFLFALWIGLLLVQ